VAAGGGEAARGEEEVARCGIMEGDRGTMDASAQPGGGGARVLVSVSGAWRAAFPGAAVGILAIDGVANPTRHPALDAWIAGCEADLRGRLAGSDRASLKALPAIQAYAAYYRRFKKTYHVQLQLESVALRGRPIPRSPALVGAMVAAELRHGLLTAGHDLDAVHPPVTVDVATGQERYRLLRGEEQTLKAGDMMMADGRGVIASVLYGPDQRTRLTERTRRVLFAVYAPAGIGSDAVARHLEDLGTAVRLVAPDAAVVAREIHGG